MTPLLRVFFRLGWEVNLRAEDPHCIREGRQKVNGTWVLSERAKIGNLAKSSPRIHPENLSFRARTCQGESLRATPWCQTSGSATQTATFGLTVIR